MHWATQLTERQYERVAVRQSTHAATNDERHTQQVAAAKRPTPRPQHQRPVSTVQAAGAASGAGAGAAKAISAAEPSSVDAPPRYSTHTCVGGKPEDNWHR